MNKGFNRLLLESHGMNLEQFNEWLKQLSVDELDDIVFAGEYVVKQVLKEMKYKE